MLYFNDGSPRHHCSHYKPDGVATVKKPGTDESLYGTKVEGALFSQFQPCSFQATSPSRTLADD